MCCLLHKGIGEVPGGREVARVSMCAQARAGKSERVVRCVVGEGLRGGDRE